MQIQKTASWNQTAQSVSVAQQEIEWQKLQKYDENITGCIGDGV